MRKTINRKPKREGYTLIEALIVVGIGIIIVSIILTAMVKMQAMFYTTDVSTDLQNESRLAMRRLSADLKRVDSRDLIAPLWHQINITQNLPINGTDSIVYHLPQDTAPADGLPDLDASGDLIWSSTNITVAVDTNSRQLIKTIGANQEVLANNVQSVNFVNHQIDPGLPIDNIRVTIELQKTPATGRTIIDQSTAMIYMRN